MSERQVPRFFARSVIFAVTSGLALLTAPLFSASASTVTQEYPVPTVASRPAGITIGGDGKLWFAEQNGSKIGRLDPAGGRFTEYALPISGTQPGGVGLGPDGNVWFTETAGSRVGRITTEGAITEFITPTLFSGPHTITAGPDGAMWFTEKNADKIARVTLGGEISEYRLPKANSSPDVITVGPDGRLWFTESDGGRIGNITTDGATVTEYDVGVSSCPHGITKGSDGALWFVTAPGRCATPTPGGGDAVARITVDGVITLFPVADGSQPHNITVGIDGNLWFTQQAGNLIGRMSPAGALLEEIPIPTSDSQPGSIVRGADGRSMWFTELIGNAIGKVAT